MRGDWVPAPLTSIFFHLFSSLRFPERSGMELMQTVWKCSLAFAWARLHWVRPSCSSGLGIYPLKTLRQQELFHIRACVCMIFSESLKGLKLEQHEAGGRVRPCHRKYFGTFIAWCSWFILIPWFQATTSRGLHASFTIATKWRPLEENGHWYSRGSDWGNVG